MEPFFSDVHAEPVQIGQKIEPLLQPCFFIEFGESVGADNCEKSGTGSEMGLPLFVVN